MVAARDIPEDELLAYFDEALPVERMTAIEQTLRGSAELRQRIAELVRRRDQGGHTLGEIWRRERLSCPTRYQLGSFLLEALEPAYAEYVEFHLSVIGCRYCRASLTDLEEAQSAPPEALRRRRRFFESSAGLIAEPPRD